MLNTAAYWVRLEIKVFSVNWPYKPRWFKPSLALYFPSLFRNFSKQYQNICITVILLFKVPWWTPMSLLLSKTKNTVRKLQSSLRSSPSSSQPYLSQMMLVLYLAYISTTLTILCTMERKDNQILFLDTYVPKEIDSLCH